MKAQPLVIPHKNIQQQLGLSFKKESDYIYRVLLYIMLEP